MSLRTTVEIDQLRNTPKSEEEWVKIHNDLAEKINRLITDLKRSEFGTAGQTIVLAGGGILFVRGGGAAGGADPGHRAGKDNVGTAETQVTFSSPIVGPFVLNKPRCYLASDIKVNVDVEIYDITTGGFKVKAAMDNSIMEWSTIGVK